MVFIHPCTPLILNAYSTVPLTAEVSTAIQHAFFDGAVARFGVPPVVTQFQDRTDFYNKSHYNIRTTLDAEGMTDTFLVLDDEVLAPRPWNYNETIQHLANAVWLVWSKEESIHMQSYRNRSGHRPVVYAGEDFTLWRVRIRTADIPSLWTDSFAAEEDLDYWIDEYVGPEPYHYDPHDPQPRAYASLELWTDSGSYYNNWGPARLTANASEILWSTRPDDCKAIWYKPESCFRLTSDAAREAGLQSAWRDGRNIPRENKSIDLDQSFDWDSPKWPPPYPDPDNIHAAPQIQAPPLSESSIMTRDTNLPSCLPWESAGSLRSPRRRPDLAQVLSNSQLTQRSTTQSPRRTRRLASAILV